MRWTIAVAGTLVGAACLGTPAMAGQAAAAQGGAQAEPAYVARGHRAEVQQRALKARLEQLHQALRGALTDAAPELLPTLEPPPVPTPGYQVLPRIVADAEPKAPSRPQVVSFSWSWSETLIGRQMAAIDRLEQRLADAPKVPSADTRRAMEALVAGYQQVVMDRRAIDADFDYNWLWQRNIHEQPGRFDEQTRLLDRLDAAQRANQPLPPDILAALASAYPAEYVRVERPSPAQWMVVVPMTTDIEDEAYVARFVEAVERHWHVQQDGVDYRVRLEMTHVTPRQVYCTEATPGATAVPCAPPAKGAAISVADHVNHFGRDRAVLTTGAGTLHVWGGRAIMLGPHDVTPLTLAHEFGHLLSFDDGYVRGYRPAGDEGYRILELALDPTDIMSASRSGSVTAGHFARIADGARARDAMNDGMLALYNRNAPAEAAARFRDVLAMRPTHYGATLQLAKALDAAGQREEAVTWWRTIRQRAADIGDTVTANAASARLAKVP